MAWPVSKTLVYERDEGVQGGDVIRTLLFPLS